MAEDMKYAVLEETKTRFRAEFLVGALHNAGIEAHTLGGTAPVFPGSPMGDFVRVVVPEDQLEQARAVVAELGDEPEAGDA